MASADEDERLVNFLEHEVFCELSDQETLDTAGEENECKEVERGGKRLHVEEGELSHLEEEEQNEAKKIKIGEGEISDKRLSSPSYLSSIELETEVEAALSPPKENDIITHNNVTNGRVSTKSGDLSRTILNEKFSQIPPELFLHILKFLSSEDLFSCSQSCRFLNLAAADESLWRRLYCMRWGMLPPRRLRECAWKRLYIQRDEEDMAKFVWNCPSEFKEYYIQMQAAKRSQAPHPSQVKDDRVILDKTLADQISMWKSSRGLADTVNHACSGVSCTYHQIGDVFICEKTGNVHVCDDTCKALVVNSRNDNFVCSISGRCFDRLVSPVEMEPDAERQQVGVTEEAESYMESGRFDRAYMFGYDCEDEKELQAAWRLC